MKYWIILSFVALAIVISGCVSQTPQESTKKSDMEKIINICSGRGDPAGTNGCYRAFAEIWLDASICNEITDTEAISECQEYIPKASSFILSESQKCDAMENLVERDNCYYGLAANAMQYKLCGKISYNLQTRDLCYSGLAPFTLDPSGCENVIDASLKNRCIGVALNDEKYCEQVTDISHRQDCYLKIAVNKRDITICDKTVGSYCYYLVLYDARDPSACERAADKDECYKVMAGRLGSSVCEKIVSVDKRTACIEAASERLIGAVGGSSIDSLGLP